MADIFHVSSVKNSRKLRQCDWCYEPIRIGEPYEAYTFRDGTDFGRTTLHRECYAASEHFAASGRFFRWSPGVFARGCCCESGHCECRKEAIARLSIETAWKAE